METEENDRKEAKTQTTFALIIIGAAIVAGVLFKAHPEVFQEVIEVIKEVGKHLFV